MAETAAGTVAVVDPNTTTRGSGLVLTILWYALIGLLIFYVIQSFICASLNTAPILVLITLIGLASIFKFFGDPENRMWNQMLAAFSGLCIIGTGVVGTLIYSTTSGSFVSVDSGTSSSIDSKPTQSCDANAFQKAYKYAVSEDPVGKVAAQGVVAIPFVLSIIVLVVSIRRIQASYPPTIPQPPPPKPVAIPPAPQPAAIPPAQPQAPKPVAAPVVTENPPQDPAPPQVAVSTPVQPVVQGHPEPAGIIEKNPQVGVIVGTAPTAPNAQLARKFRSRIIDIWRQKASQRSSTTAEMHAELTDLATNIKTLEDKLKGRAVIRLRSVVELQNLRNKLDKLNAKLIAENNTLTKEVTALETELASLAKGKAKQNAQISESEKQKTEELQQVKMKLSESEAKHAKMHAELDKLNNSLANMEKQKKKAEEKAAIAMSEKQDANKARAKANAEKQDAEKLRDQFQNQAKRALQSAQYSDDQLKQFEERIKQVVKRANQAADAEQQAKKEKEAAEKRAKNAFEAGKRKGRLIRNKSIESYREKNAMWGGRSRSAPPQRR